jgi:hypothetical protein
VGNRNKGLHVTHHHEMSLKGDFCDDFSTTLDYLKQGIIDWKACVSNEDFDLICISSGGGG